jgi:hypothetical protein
LAGDNDGAQPCFVAFAGTARLASGALAEVAAAVLRLLEQQPHVAIITFNRETARVVDLDLRGTEQEVIARYALAAPPAVKRGRPPLGVVAREVTLLPRHWEWLARQPGGASVTLRKLVEAARKADTGETNVRTRIELAYRFMSAIAGNLAGFEEAARALFAGDRTKLATLLSPWPPDIRDEVLRFLDGVSEESSP